MYGTAVRLRVGRGSVKSDPTLPDPTHEHC